MREFAPIEVATTSTSTQRPAGVKPARPEAAAA